MLNDPGPIRAKPPDAASSQLSSAASTPTMNSQGPSSLSPARPAAGTELRAERDWDLVLTPKRGWFEIDILELWRYRELILLLFKRDFVATYKQTILGPLWYLISPLLTSAMFFVVFSLVARIPTGDMPPFLFYYSGVVVWNYFSNCVGKNSDTFTANAGIFGKVYFPRLVVPVSACLSSLIAFAAQFVLLLVFVWYFSFTGAKVSSSISVVLVIPVLLYVALLGLSIGNIFSALTVRFRDLMYLVGTLMQIWMYATPVVYPRAFIPDSYQWAFMLNPMVAPIETFRVLTLGGGYIDWSQWMSSLACGIVLTLVGLSLFARGEQNSMDTV